MWGILLWVVRSELESSDLNRKIVGCVHGVTKNCRSSNGRTGPLEGSNWGSIYGSQFVSKYLRKYLLTK